MCGCECCGCGKEGKKKEKKNECCCGEETCVICCPCECGSGKAKADCCGSEEKETMETGEEEDEE